jgi:hypothetical protein
MARLHRTSPALLVALVLPACAPPPSGPTPDERVGEASEALKIAGLFATGLDANGALLPNGSADPHYALTSTDAALPGPKTFAVAPSAGWLANTPTSKWLSAQASTKGAAGAKYTYTTTFSLYGQDPATATITGKLACDDTCVVTLNGTQVAKDDGANAWASLASFTVAAGGPFVVGQNSLAVVVTNTSGNTGVHVAELSGTASGCSADAQCQAGWYCDNVAATCQLKLDNGKPIPTIAGHVPTLDGKCTADAGAAVCKAGVCDPKDNLCALADGDGPCTSLSGPVVCRSKTCSKDGTCMPAAGCNVDADCVTGFCSVSTHACAQKVANGDAMPKDPGHVKPVLDGVCSAEAAALVCISGVCDPKDDKCGLALGDGPCTQQNAGVVCRSGACSVGGTCLTKGTCNVDGDCAGGGSAYCHVATNSCQPTAANGQPLPGDPGHVKPTLDGTCTKDAAAIVCTSGVCDAADDLCGYADGHGPCTDLNGPVVCRSGACSLKLVCLPVGGCNYDADCEPTQYCDSGTSHCAAKVANGAAIPSVPDHPGATLDGTCSLEAGKAACASGVCDPADDLCGLADGDGPCTQAEADRCRSGQCSHNGTCTVKGGCNIDVDCLGGKWCATGSHACVDPLANGEPMPTEPDHASPALDGTCTSDAAALVCASGVCDPGDAKCGLADGSGPCSAADAGTVCRSGECTNGICGAGCAKDGDCAAPTPVCDAEAKACVACTPANDAACGGATPICDAASKACVKCDGDLGSGAKHACAKDGAPLCTPKGCGTCATDDDCAGHPGGAACDAKSGACVTGCTADADCAKTEWCAGGPGAPGVCTKKLANGAPLPKSPEAIAHCTPEVGARVCASGVCDPKDESCGLAAGDGPCAGDEECRGTTCSAATKTCALPAGACASDADCAGGTCRSGACVPKPAAATPPAEESGGCAASGRGRGDGALATLGLALVALAARRRRPR